MNDFTIRATDEGDAPLILALLAEMAAYENQPFALTEAAVTRDMLGSDAVCPSALAFIGDACVGIASWYWAYRSFGGVRLLYVEDLFVRPAFRGRGMGRSLLAWLAVRAKAADGIMEWRVLDWNADAIAFYKSLGATPVPGWINCRLGGAALEKLAAS